MCCNICQKWRAKLPGRTKPPAHRSNPVSTPSMNPAAGGSPSAQPVRDYITALPAELLLKIFPHLPLQSFYHLSHTSSFLRHFIQTHASLLCNDAIKAYFPVQAKIMETEKISGWLVPTYEELRKREELFSDCMGYDLRDLRLCQHNPTKTVPCEPFDSLTDFRRFQVKITNPGPQYLMFLQRGFLQAGVLYWYREEPIFIFRKEFNDFMREFNNRVTCRVCVRDGKLDTARLKLPKELLWYYGIEQARSLPTSHT